METLVGPPQPRSTRSPKDAWYGDSLHTIYSLGKISFRGDEARLRFLASVVLNAAPRLTLMSRVGVERVSNFAASGQGASNLMGELTVRSAY